jgi:hypothetical protein
MRTRRLLIVLLLSAWPAAAEADQAPQPKEAKEETYAVEIDFSPLASVPKTVRQYRLHLTARSASGKTYKDNFTVDNGLSVPALVDQISESFGSIDWETKVLDGTKLVVEGHKGRPVVHFELKAEGLPKGNVLPKDNVPKFKRLPKGDKRAPRK